MSQWEQTGDGSVQTTVLDLAKWDANFYDPKVGGRALIDALQQRGKLADGKVLDYAAGLVHGTYRGQPTVSHGGAWAGYRAELLRFPGLKASVIVLCNAATAQPGTLANQIADVVLERHLAPVPPPPRAAAPALALTAAELDAWVGKYREVPGGGIASVIREGAQLSLEVGGSKFPLAPVTKQTFKLPLADIVVELSGAAPKRKLAIRSPHLNEDYEELVPHALPPAELAGHAGRYRSAEAAVDWTLAVAGGKLVASGPGLEDGALVPTVKDELSMPAAGITLVIARGPRGVTGFTARYGALQLRFDRVP
jgi:hypothetical protein